jgi:two-component system response regulator AtoC
MSYDMAENRTSVRTIMVVDDELRVRKIFTSVLEEEGYRVIPVAGGREALLQMNRELPDAVLLDLNMPGINGVDTLRELKRQAPDLPVIIVTATNDIRTAVSAIQLGAQDFVLKPPDFDLLLHTLRKTLETQRLQYELRKVNTELESSLEYLLGRSEPIKRVIELILRVASSNFSVLIQGETGTGKTFAARIIHNLSPRKNGSFVVVDMGAMPETLVESELFGYEKGAFTGAIKRKPGYFETASGGTIVIDELQNMSPYVQSKLLKVVEERKASPLGGIRSVDVDVRIIGVSNADLQHNVTERTFREDLFYRLSEVVISIPPLRERRDDIPFFINKFLVATCDELSRDVMEIADDAMALLVNHTWPGNVRELRNVIKRIALFAQEDVVTADHVARTIGNLGSLSPHSTAAQPHPSIPDSPPPMPLHELEQIAIMDTLAFTGGNKSRAAAILQIDYKTLLRKLKHYGV